MNHARDNVYLSKTTECTIYTAEQCGEYRIPDLGIHKVDLLSEQYNNKQLSTAPKSEQIKNNVTKKGFRMIGIQEWLGPKAQLQHQYCYGLQRKSDKQS